MVNNARFDDGGVMKPAPFDYIRVDSIEHAIEILNQAGDEAKILAGGQSLIPMMRLRFARPSLLVDISRINGLRGTERDGDTLRIGALTRHADLEYGEFGTDGRVALPILGRIAGHIGHLPIRTKGTIGGSLAHADPASEWCLLALAMDATMHITGPRGARKVSAMEFFQGFMTTSLKNDEILVAVELGVSSTKIGFQEFSRRHGDFAVAAVAVAIDTDFESGLCRSASIAVAGVGETVIRVPLAEEALVNQHLDSMVIAQASERAKEAIPSDTEKGSDFRRNLVGELVIRALNDTGLARDSEEF